MAGNVLTGKIVIDSSGVSKSFNDVSLRLKDQRAILKSLQQEYAKLSTAQIASPFGKELAADIRIANAEIKRLEAGAVPAFGAVGNAATKGFSAVRQFAYLLPGIGIAGLLGGLSEMVVGLFKSSDAFDKASLAAEIFKDQLDDIKAASERLEGFLQLQNKLADLKFRIGGGEGAAADINNFNNQLASTNTVIKDATNNLNKFNDTEQKLIKGIKEVSSLMGEFGEKNPLVELALSGKDLTKITKEEADKLPKILRGPVNAFIENRKAIIDEDKRYTQAIGEQTLLRLQIQKTESDESRRLGKEAFQELVRKQFDLSQAGSRVKFNIAGTAALDLDKVKLVLIGTPKIPTFAEKVAEQIEKGLEALVIKPNVQIAVPPEALTDAAKAAQQLTATFQAAVTSGIENAFASIGEAIGGALSGEDFGGKLFGIIGDFLIQIGKAMIAFGGIKKIVEEVLKNFAVPAAVAIGIGVVAIAAGTALKNIKNAQPRALGGPVNAGGSFLVGERGPELFVPNTGGQIVPNNRIGGGTGGGNGMVFQVVGTNIIQGQDLLQVFTLAQQSQRRLQ